MAPFGHAIGKCFITVLDMTKYNALIVKKHHG